MVRKPLAFSASEPDELGIEIQRIDKGHILFSMSAHSHEFLEIIYFDRGGGQYQHENCIWDVEAGDLFLTAPYETHDASKLSEAQGWVILFTAATVNPTGLESSSYLQWINSPIFFPFAKNSGFESRHIRITEMARPQWLQRLQSLNTELSDKPFGYKEMARSLLTQILIDITRLTIGNTNRFPTQVSPLLVEVFDFIEQHFSKSISLADIAKAMNRSPSYLSASVRKLTGRTILEWIRERRMTEARRLLLETNDDIVQIAEAIGYQEVTYFIRQFRQFHRETPQAWRQVHR
ncbi:MAG: AraC family transcriptional regulator [Leptolyngbyaceae bacterium]|nr:AraC family transcriptional regulator [Leptolyngbyaceae bacterium]